MAASLLYFFEEKESLHSPSHPPEAANSLLEISLSVVSERSGDQPQAI